ERALDRIGDVPIDRLAVVGQLGRIPVQESGADDDTFDVLAALLGESLVVNGVLTGDDGRPVLAMRRPGQPDDAEAVEQSDERLRPRAPPGENSGGVIRLSPAHLRVVHHFESVY